MDRVRRQRRKQQDRQDAQAAMMGSPQGVELKSLSSAAAAGAPQNPQVRAAAVAPPQRPRSNVGVSLLDFASPEPAFSSSPEEILQDLRNSSSSPEDDDKKSVRRELQSQMMMTTTQKTPPKPTAIASTVHMKRPPTTPETRAKRYSAGRAGLSASPAATSLRAQSRYSYGSAGSPGHRLSTGGINPIAPLREEDEEEDEHDRMDYKKSKQYHRYPTDGYTYPSTTNLSTPTMSRRGYRGQNTSPQSSTPPEIRSEYEKFLMDDTISIDDSRAIHDNVSPMSKVSIASGSTVADDQSVRRPFKKQVRELDTLLTSPELRLGALASTTKLVASPDEEDDYLDMELQDVAKSQQALQAELAAAELSMVAPTPESIPEYTPSPQQRSQENLNDVSALASPEMDLSSRAYKSSSSSSEGKQSSTGSSFVKRHLFQSSSESGSSPSNSNSDQNSPNQNHRDGKSKPGQSSSPVSTSSDLKQAQQPAGSATPELAASPELLRSAHTGEDPTTSNRTGGFFSRLFQRPEKEIVFEEASFGDNDDGDDVEVHLDHDDGNDDSDQQWVNFVPPSPIQQASPLNSSRNSANLSTGSISVKDPTLSIATTPDSKSARESSSFSISTTPNYDRSGYPQQSQSQDVQLASPSMFLQSKLVRPTASPSAKSAGSRTTTSSPNEKGKDPASSVASSPTYYRVKYLNRSLPSNESMSSSSVYIQEDQPHVQSMSILSGDMSMEEGDPVEVDLDFEPKTQPVTPLGDPTQERSDGMDIQNVRDSTKYVEASQEVVYSEDLLHSTSSSSPIVKRYPERSQNKSTGRTNMMYSESLLSPVEEPFQSPPPPQHFFSPMSSHRIQVPDNPPTVVSHAATVTPDHATNLHAIGAFSPPDPVWPEDEYHASPFEDRDISFDDTRKDRQPLFPSFGIRSDGDAAKSSNWYSGKSPSRRRGYASFSEDAEDRGSTKAYPSTSSSWVAKMFSALSIPPLVRNPSRVEDKKSSSIPDHVPLDSPDSLKDTPLAAQQDQEIQFFDVRMELDKNWGDDGSDKSPGDDQQGSLEDIFRNRTPLPAPSQENSGKEKKIPQKEVTRRTRVCYLFFFILVLVLATVVAVVVWLDYRNDNDDKSIDSGELPGSNGSVSPTAPPTLYPTLSSAPTMSMMPSYSPSLSMLPTVSMAPSLSPTFPPSVSPTSSDVIVTTAYNIFVENGIVDNIPSLEYRLDLIEAMDLLATQVFDSIVDEERRRFLMEILSVPVIRLPTAITSIRERPCPTPSSTDRCEEVTADILLYSGKHISEEFKKVLEVGIELGSLQAFLEEVEPDSPVAIIDMNFHSPSDSPTVSPSLSPSQSPSTGTQSPSAIPTISPQESPTPSPSSSPSFGTTVPSDQLELFQLLAKNSFDDGAALRDPSSPQHKAFQWLAGDNRLEQFRERKILQRYVFATLYYSTNGDNWSRNDRWLSNRNECDWYSKTGRRDVCDPSGDAVSLELDFNNLQGTLPPGKCHVWIDNADIANTIVSDYFSTSIFKKLVSCRIHWCDWILAGVRKQS